MLKYLVIQLDNTSVSFCHYNNGVITPHLIDLRVLKESIVWSMKENLTVQFVYPDYELPSKYKSLISEVDHADIISSTCEDNRLKKSADVVVFNLWTELGHFELNTDQAYVIRTSLSDLLSNDSLLKEVLPKVSRLNVIVTDMENFDMLVEKAYSQLLSDVSDKILKEYEVNHMVQLNILTDRMLLDAMNNCGAGDESITLAPDGKFYVCPGFYLDGSDSVGDVYTGLDVKNSQLYRLDHAPICRICDAWQCKRCVWLNKKFTLEVNTPGREQCVIAHIERNTSSNLMASIRKLGTFLPHKEIPKISYLDPFDEILKNN